MYLRLCFPSYCPLSSFKQKNTHNTTYMRTICKSSSRRANDQVGFLIEKL